MKHARVAVWVQDVAHRATGMLAALLLGLCASTTIAEPVLTDFRIAGKFDGWKETPKTFVQFDHSKLFELIDGAAPEYIDNGLVAGMHQQLEDRRGATADIYVEDFADSTKASGMYLLKRSQQTGPLVIPGQDSARSCAVAGIGGMTFYAWMDRFYIEMVLSGIAPPDSVLARAGRLLAWYGRTYGR